MPDVAGGQHAAAFFVGGNVISDKAIEPVIVASRKRFPYVHAAAAARSRIAELDKELSEAAEKENRIKQMFLSGVVNKSNSDFWNAELLTARTAKSQIEKEIAAASAPPKFEFDEIFPDLM